MDYWNHDGWKDPYSSAAMTDRQEDYVRVLRLESPATPQVIVDGTVNLHVYDAKQVKGALEQAAAATTVPVHILSATVDTKDPAVVQARVEVDGTFAPHSAEVYAALALNHAESQVLRGENGGKHLAHTAVLEKLTKVGKLEKGKTFSSEIAVKLMPGEDPGNLRLIVFVQEPGPGKVLGAAMQQGIH